MFWQSGFWSAGFWADGFWEGDEQPDVAPILLGRRPAVSRTRENDEALLLMLGML
jgi:hypothetical protein